jgi:hypothetical protein
MAGLIAIDEIAEKASEVARRAARWILASYIGPPPTTLIVRRSGHSQAKTP